MWPGGLNNNGRKEEEFEGTTVMNGSSSALHITMVPPCAADRDSG